MKLKTLAALGALAPTALAVMTGAAWAAEAKPPVPNSGDTAYMIMCSILVLMMSVPGLALFYGGLVRTKNMLSVLTQVFMIVSLGGITWTLYGYSLALGASGSPYIGGFDKVMLAGVTTSSNAATFSNGVVIPEFAFILFQMTFFMITPALIIGAFAERMKFSAVLLFTLLWSTFIYLPIAHWVWAIAAPDDVANAAKAIAAAGSDAVKKAAAEAEMAKVLAPVGWLASAGAIDFAGGTVVHINAGIAGLVCAIVLGKRTGYGKEAMPPHSLTMTMIGASLLWVGWFGFNAGSNLEANGLAALAAVNTMVATCAAAFSWMLCEWAVKGKPSLLGMVSGAIAGLVAITPACGFASPMGAIVLGLLVSPICLMFCTSIKHALGYDDALDVFGIHCIAGIIGAIGTGILVNPAFGGVGITDYTNFANGNVGSYSMIGQLIAQSTAVGATLIYSGIGTFVILMICKLVVGLRPAEEKEREGLDITEHGERAYNY
ncbi:MAG: ammonium transporter [Hyphomicrobiaceae bacterium]|nr:ammonium transporter [Hyphomicrobiaceae bacterium]